MFFYHTSYYPYYQKKTVDHSFVQYLLSTNYVAGSCKTALCPQMAFSGDKSFNHCSATMRKSGGAVTA